MAAVTCPDCGKMVTDRCVCGYRVTAAVRPSESPIGAVIASATGSDPFAVAPRSVVLTFESAGNRRSVSIEVGERVEVGSSVGPLMDLCTNNISGHHASFTLSENGVSVEDIGSSGNGSTNGTFVNGTRIRPREQHRLESGDVVELARDPALRIVVSEA